MLFGTQCCGCCCVEDAENPGQSLFDFSKKNRCECADAGGAWVPCPGPCGCPPCVPFATIGGIDITTCFGNINAPGSYTVILVGERDAAANPFGFPVTQFGTVNKVRVVATFAYNWHCEPNEFVLQGNTLEIYISLWWSYVWDEGLTVGNCYDLFTDSTFGNGLRQWFFRYQGNPPGASRCWGDSSPPLVLTEITGNGPPVEGDVVDLFDEGPIVTVSCNGAPVSCEP